MEISVTLTVPIGEFVIILRVNVPALKAAGGPVVSTSPMQEIVGPDLLRQKMELLLLMCEEINSVPSQIKKI